MPITSPHIPVLDIPCNLSRTNTAFQDSAPRACTSVEPGTKSINERKTLLGVARGDSRTRRGLSAIAGAICELCFALHII
jgi:hypothetical protein